MKSELFRHNLEAIESFDHETRVILLAPLPGFWDDFKASPEALDNAPDPMDRYSRRLIKPLASKFKLEAFFPSDGPPYPPFVRWAQNASEIYASPVGLFVHAKFGLWISFRGALVGGEPQSLEPRISPCQNCQKPCLEACPIDAFEEGFYDAKKCRDYLKSGAVSCWQGCLVRRICPAAQVFRDEAQSRFHMEAFVH